MNLLLCALLAAGWQGAARFTYVPPRKAPQHDGRVFWKPGNGRLDTQLGASPATLLAAPGGAITLLLPETHEFLDLGPELAPPTALPPACATPAPRCLAASGYARAGTEVLAGVETDRWERTSATPMGEVREKLWTLPGSELVFLRAEASTTRGRTRIDVVDLRRGPQPDALFAVPKGFAKMKRAPPPEGAAPAR